MTIGLEASRANKRQKTGTEWYAWHIIQEFKKLSSDNKFVIYYNQELEPVLAQAPANFYLKKLSWPFKKFWTHIRLGLYLYFKPVDIFFATNSVPLFHRGKLIVTIHDLGFLKNPELYHPLERVYQKISHWLAISKADKIIAISHATADDIKRFYPRVAAKVRVIHLGWNQNQFSQITGQEKNIIREKYSLPEDFLVYAGRIEEKKNLAKMIQAYITAKIDWPLVLIGRPGNYGFEKIEALARNISNIHLLGYIKQNDFGKILASASAMVFPSKYEGFGLPILEAMGAGVPVACSDIAALREVAQDAAIYFDPDSSSDMGDKMLQIVGSSDLRAKLISLGIARANEFSWFKCAEETLNYILE